ncbi:MAG: hypothetical protein ACF8Q5_01570 [Phycisphaerales bacterium JB040]
MPTHEDNTHRPQRPGPTVVLFHAPGEPVPRELTDALARNNAVPILTDHAAGALALLCTHRPGVLLLDRHAELPALHDLLDAVDRYAPRAVRWEYLPGAEPPLRPVANPRAGAPAPDADGRASHAPQPRDAALRLTSDQLGSPRDTPSSASDILSKEEMHALFSKDAP